MWITLWENAYSVVEKSILKKYWKKVKKGVDKMKQRWYNMQAVAREGPRKRVLGGTAKVIENWTTDEKYKQN